jgi:HEAT repeat protein
MPGIPELQRQLMKALDDPQADVRLAAARAIWNSEPKSIASALPAVIAMLQHKEPVARQRAADLLGDLGSAGRPAVPALLDALRDENLNVRRAVATALVRIDPAAAAKAGIR